MHLIMLNYEKNRRSRSLSKSKDSFSSNSLSLMTTYQEFIMFWVVLMTGQPTKKQTEAKTYLLGKKSNQRTHRRWVVYKHYQSHQHAVMFDVLYSLILSPTPVTVTHKYNALPAVHIWHQALLLMYILTESSYFSAWLQSVPTANVVLWTIHSIRKITTEPKLIIFQSAMIVSIFIEKCVFILEVGIKN